MLPCDVATGMQVVVDPTPRSTTGSPSNWTPEQPAPVQGAARAAKRQRGRERRKMYRAEAHASKSLQEEEAQASKCLEEEREKQAIGFEARAAEVATHVKLVVRNGFYDVDSSEDMSSDDDFPLPSTFFKSTGEIDEWRRDYRRFRLGHHQGAKGEVTTKDFALENLAGLDLWSSVEMKLRPLAALPA